MKNKYVRIMFDYCATAFWGENGGNLDYDEVPISKELREFLEDWTLRMDKKMWYWDSSGESNLKGVTKPDIEALCEEGRKLAIKVKHEIPEWTVIYFDELKAENTEDHLNRDKFEYEITLEDV